MPKQSRNVSILASASTKCNLCPKSSPLPQAAQHLSVEAHGTLGILLRAIRKQQMSRAYVIQLLRELPQRSTLHVRPGLLADIIQSVEELPQ